MGKLALLLICLAMLSTCCATSFQRPWENKSWIANNPSIWSYGVEVWWNIPALNKTLENIDIQKTEGLEINGSAKTHIERAFAHGLEANYNAAKCMESDLLEPLWGYVIGGPALGTFVSLMSEFSRISSCVAYRQSWVALMESSLSTLEESIEETEESLRDARTAYEEIEFMGLCNSNYTRTGSEDCAEIQSAFNTVDNNITEGKYGKYPLLLNYSHELSKRLAEPSPDMSLYGTMMGLIWGETGTISLFDAISVRTKDAKNRAEVEFQSLTQSAEGRKHIVSQELQELKRQDVHLISGAPSSYEVRKPGTVSELLTDIQGREDRLSICFRDMKMERNRLFKRGHMANAILGMAEINDAYAELTIDIEVLEEYARDVVAQQATEAESELEKTREFIGSSVQSSESVGLYNKAESLYEEGEKATTLGMKFAAYSKATAYARAAQNQRVYEEELAQKSLLNELKGLIKNAEKDEINIVTERESLKLLEKLQPYQIDEHISSSIDSIILKARIKYDDDLLEIRKRLYDKLSLAGPSASDLYTDLARYEDGLMEGGQVNYPAAIGQLKKLKEDYLALEEELEQYLGDIVGNSMSTTATPLIDSVRLDGPSNITLDVVITNARNYGAGSAAAKVSLPTPIPFLYSHIVQGKEGVESLHMLDGSKTLVLVLSGVNPFEARRIVLKKQDTIAHTLKRTAENTGIGNDAARVIETIEFQLDMDVPRLDLPDGLAEAIIDGADPGRPLKAGKHIMSSERIMDNAYSEKIENIKSYAIGTNCKVVYDVRILPKIDLDSIIVFIDSINDSRISSLNVVAATGEGIKEKKRVSESQYTAKASGLNKDRTTVLKISYNVEDTESLVAEQINQLEAANLSDGSRESLEQAKVQAEAGNYSKALEFLEKSRALSKEEEKQRTKLQQKYEKLNKKLVDELDEISAALSSTNISAPLMGKLSARKDELERVVDEAKDSNLGEKVGILEKTDFKWLEKELKSLKKDAYTEYNDLKERFYLAGNSSTPPQFLKFEAALNKLETGGRLEYAVQTLEALENARAVIESQEVAYQHNKESMRSTFERIKSEVGETLERYSEEAAAAKGTEYSSLFGESERKTRDMIKEAEKLLDEDPRLFQIKLTSLNKSRQRMQLTLNSLENESKARLFLVETLFDQSGMEEKKRKEIAAKIEIMHDMLAAGEYVNALRAGSAIAKDIDSYERPQDNSLLILGITALAVLAIVAAYIVRQQKGEEKKQLRKLEKAGEVPQQP